MNGITLPTSISVPELGSLPLNLTAALLNLLIPPAGRNALVCEIATDATIDKFVSVDVPTTTGAKFCHEKAANASPRDELPPDAQRSFHHDLRQGFIEGVGDLLMFSKDLPPELLEDLKRATSAKGDESPLAQRFTPEAARFMEREGIIPEAFEGTAIFEMGDLRLFSDGDSMGKKPGRDK